MLIPYTQHMGRTQQGSSSPAQRASLSQSFGAHTPWPTMEPWHHHPSELHVAGMGQQLWPTTVNLINLSRNLSPHHQLPNPPCHAHQLLSSKRQRTTYYLRPPTPTPFIPPPTADSSLNAMQPGHFYISKTQVIAQITSMYTVL